MEGGVVRASCGSAGGVGNDDKLSNCNAMFGYDYGVLHRSSSQLLYIIATISTDILYAHASTRAIDSIASNRSTNSQSLFNGRLCKATEAIY